MFDVASAAFQSIGMKKGTLSRALFHIVDWLPTLASLVGASVNATKTLDGVNQMPMLRGQEKSLSRKEVFDGYTHTKNVSEKYNERAIRLGPWKYTKTEKSEKYCDLRADKTESGSDCYHSVEDFLSHQLPSKEISTTTSNQTSSISVAKHFMVQARNRLQEIESTLIAFQPNDLRSCNEKMISYQPLPWTESGALVRSRSQNLVIL